MNKTELAQKIQALDGLSNEDKSTLLELLHTQKKYGLVWEDKPEDVEKRLETELPVLREVTDRAIVSDTPDAPNHILVEGDNLEVLTALSYTHAGKIDVIYIDPPYNTGGRDFVYNDSYIDTTDDYRHSKWLSFMSKRLRIAKRLLSPRGVIFMSIDDNEQAPLKMLCDEIFRPENFAANIIWEKADSPRMDAKVVSTRHDYILVYCKDISQLPIQKIRTSEIPSHYNKVDENGKRYYLKPLRYMGNGDAREDRPNLFYALIAPDGTEVYPKRADGSDGRWRWAREKYEKEKGRVEFIKTKNGWSANTRLYASEGVEVPVETIWYNKDVGSNRNAIASIKEIFGAEKTFSTPKPVKLIERIIQVTTYQQSNILDFFAGSGTTLHATMQLNAEDGGHRTCILCTNNENGICENVTYERNKRVIQGYTTPKGEQVAGLTDNNLRYYCTELLPQERTNKNMRELVKASTGLLCIKNDLYTEAPFGGRKLNSNFARYFEHGDKRMLVIYNEQAIPFIVNIIKEMPVEGKIKVYVFSYGSDPYEADFAEVCDHVTLCALPDAIYNAYKKVLPKRKPKFSVDELVEEIIEEEETEEVSDGSIDFNNGYGQEGGIQ